MCDSLWLSCLDFPLETLRFRPQKFDVSRRVWENNAKTEGLSAEVSTWWFECGPESEFPQPILTSILLRNTPSTAGNSMTGSERHSPEPLLKEEASLAVLGGREFWKCSGSLKCLELQGLGDPSCTLEGNSRRSSESASGVFPEFFRNFFRKVPAVLGVWPIYLCLTSSLPLLDGPIRANRFPDSRESGESPDGSHPLSCESRFGAPKRLRIAGLRRFARIARTL